MPFGARCGAVADARRSHSADSIVKKDGTYYLYYAGSDGPRGDSGPAHRAIGVATSTDGVSVSIAPTATG